MGRKGNTELLPLVLAGPGPMSAAAALPAPAAGGCVSCCSCSCTFLSSLSARVRPVRSA